MRLLGIDPGLALTGYACLDLGSTSCDPVLVEAGVIRLDRRQPMPARLGHLYDDLCRVLDDLTPEQMIVEQLFSHYRHARTAILMGHARGTVLLAGQQRGVTLGELTPAEVKKAVTGNGQASKTQVQEAVVAQLGLSVAPEPNDISDAMAIALCGLRRWHARSVVTATS